jgi:hypothetical protein
MIKSKIAATVVGGALVTALVVAAGTTASARTSVTGADIAGSSITSSHIKDQTIQSRDIAADGVGGSELRAGSVGTSELSSAAKSYIASMAGADGAKGENGAQGTPGAPCIDGTDGVDGAPGIDGTNGTNGTDGADAFVDSDTVKFGPTVIEQLGGSWRKTGTALKAIGHTKVGTVELKAGTYLVSVNASYWKSSALASDTTATPSLQLQVNSGVRDGEFPDKTYVTTWTDFPAGGAAGERPGSGVLEQTSSAYQIVTLDADTILEVDAFGQNPGTGYAGSGDFSVIASLSWVQVGVQS